MSKKHYYAITPGGSICIETKASNEEECWQKLQKELAHMPYRNLDAIKHRGYEVELI